MNKRRFFLPARKIISALLFFVGLFFLYKNTFTVTIPSDTIGVYIDTSLSMRARDTDAWDRIDASLKILEKIYEQYPEKKYELFIFSGDIRRVHPPFSGKDSTVFFDDIRLAYDLHSGTKIDTVLKDIHSRDFGTVMLFTDGDFFEEIQMKKISKHGIIFGIGNEKPSKIFLRNDLHGEPVYAEKNGEFIFTKKNPELLKKLKNIFISGVMVDNETDILFPEKKSDTKKFSLLLIIFLFFSGYIYGTFTYEKK